MIFFLIIFLLYVLVTGFLFFHQAFYYDGESFADKYLNDMWAYISYMQGINEGYDYPYPIMFWIGKFFWLFFRPEIAMAITVTLLNAVSVLVLKYYFDKYMKQITKWNIKTAVGSTLLTLSSFLVSMLFLDLSERSLNWRYIGVFSPNPYHNATYLATRPFSIVCFFMFVDILQIYDQDVKRDVLFKKYILFALCLLLTTMTKPSFVLGFIIMAALVLFYRTCRQRFGNIKQTLQLAACTIPTFAALLYQYKGIFLDVNSQGEETGIGFGWLTAWSVTNRSFREGMMFGLAFPVLVLLLNIKQLKEMLLYRMAWIYFTVNWLMVTCLYEKGFRLGHINFAWGYMHAMFFIYLISMMLLVKLTVLNKDRNSAFGLSRMSLALQWGVYAWHLVCGAVYFGSLLEGNGFL